MICTAGERPCSLFQAFRWWSASEKYSERKNGKKRGAQSPLLPPTLSLTIFSARAALSERLERARDPEKSSKCLK